MNTDSQSQSNCSKNGNGVRVSTRRTLDITATNGIVTLIGQGTHYAEMPAAEDAAKRVFGVKGVANAIVVDMRGDKKRTDQDADAAALAAFKWDFHVSDSKIRVVVANGTITLSGNVDWQYQKDAAEKYVSYMMGVSVVSNEIKIQPETKWSDVKTIEDAFRCNAVLEARRIAVTTDLINLR